MDSSLSIHLNYDQILDVCEKRVKALSRVAEPGNAILPAQAGVLRHAIQENGVPRGITA